MKELILLDGLPRTGKSTIAALLVQKLKTEGYNAMLYSMRDKIPEYARANLAHYYAGCVDAFYAFVDHLPDDAILVCDRSPFTELVYGPIRSKTIGKEAMIIPQDIIVERIKGTKYTLVIMDNEYSSYIDRGAEQKDGFTYGEEAFNIVRDSMLTQAKLFENSYIVPPTKSLAEANAYVLRYIAPEVQQKIDFNSSQMYDACRLSLSKRIEMIHKYILALGDESYELLRATKYKQHQPGKPTLNIDNAKEEAIDVFKYLLCIVQLLGMTGADFAKWFYYKSDIVQQRYDNRIKQKSLTKKQ
jgi:thymidylate kinase/NTP pyrophosphatase (non-canonical NTP hydrolase)